MPKKMVTKSSVPNICKQDMVILMQNTTNEKETSTSASMSPPANLSRIIP